MSVITNRISPRSTSDDVYRSPTASVNSLAMVAEMVVPGASNDGQQIRIWFGDEQFPVLSLPPIDVAMVQRDD